MFELNFIAKPGIQAESSEASWSFLKKSTNSETESTPKSSIEESKIYGAHWKDYGIIAFAVIIFSVISLFVHFQPKVISQDMVLTQIIDLIIESGYMNELQLMEAHFRPDFVKVTITTSELNFIQNFTQRYHVEDKVSYEIFQKNELNYVSLNFPWEGDKKGGDIETLKTLANNKMGFSNKTSISFTDNEFELHGRSSDIISYLLQMADNGLIQKFTLSILHLESGRFNLKVRVNKI